jgi:hypothetical protein
MCCPPDILDVVRVRFSVVLEQLRREIAMMEEVMFANMPGLIPATPESSDWGSDDDLDDLPDMEWFAR